MPRFVTTLPFHTSALWSRAVETVAVRPGALPGRLGAWQWAKAGIALRLAAKASLPPVIF